MQTYKQRSSSIRNRDEGLYIFRAPVLMFLTKASTSFQHLSPALQKCGHLGSYRPNIQHQCKYKSPLLIYIYIQGFPFEIPQFSCLRRQFFSVYSNTLFSFQTYKCLRMIFFLIQIFWYAHDDYTALNFLCKIPYIGILKKLLRRLSL